MRKCKHRWSVTGATYMPPRTEASVEHGSEELARILLFGATTVSYVCEECGEYRADTLPGKVTLRDGTSA